MHTRLNKQLPLSCNRFTQSKVQPWKMLVLIMRYILTPLRGVSPFKGSMKMERERRFLRKKQQERLMFVTMIASERAVWTVQGSHWWEEVVCAPFTLGSGWRTFTCQEPRSTTFLMIYVLKPFNFDYTSWQRHIPWKLMLLQLLAKSMSEEEIAEELTSIESNKVIVPFNVEGNV